MNPYLEATALWQGTHNALIALMRAALNAVLPAPYVAVTEIRCYIEWSSESIRPDLALKESHAPPRPTNAVALAEPFSPSVDYQLQPLEYQEAYLNIVHAEDRQRIVTSVEDLSHTNQGANAEGRRLYRAKQEALLNSDASLVEIDLLRAGQFSLAVPYALLTPEQQRKAYRVCLHRAWTPGKFTVWATSVQERLPVLRIPLDEHVAEVPLDLQPLIERNYEEGAYRYQINYAGEAVPPLTGEDATWADALLREKGLR
jgi:hypothetical protein